MHVEIDGAQQFNALAAQAAERRGRTVSELAREAGFHVSALRVKAPRDHGLKMYKLTVEQLDRWTPLSSREIVEFSPYWLPEKYLTNNPVRWIFAIKDAVREVASLPDESIAEIADLVCQRVGVMGSSEPPEPAGPILNLTDEPNPLSIPRDRRRPRRSR